MISLKVGNLTYRTTPEDLRRVFEKFGSVGDIYIPKDRFSRESRGFAFVRLVYFIILAFNLILVVSKKNTT
jgi:arginine/serine-rich splicing factor 2